MRLVQARLTSTEAAYHEALNTAHGRPPALLEGPWQGGVPHPDNTGPPEDRHPAGQQSASLPLPGVGRGEGHQAALLSASLPLTPRPAGSDARAAGGDARAAPESAAGTRLPVPPKEARRGGAEEEPGLAVRQLALWA